jgi:SH3-like domain-containing protein
LSRNARTIVGALSGLAMLLAGVPATAAAADEETSLKVPRFVSLHADKVNLRTGPGQRYPIEWVLTKKDMPVEVIAQFEHWRRIRDWDGTVGWVQEHMVAGRRYVVVGKGGDRPLHQQPDAGSAVIARAEPGVVARLLECRGAWCRVEADNISGWLRRTDIWGVYPDEKVP